MSMAVPFGCGAVWVAVQPMRAAVLQIMAQIAEKMVGCIAAMDKEMTEVKSQSESYTDEFFYHRVKVQQSVAEVQKKTSEVERNMVAMGADTEAKMAALQLHMSEMYGNVEVVKHKMVEMQDNFARHHPEHGAARNRAITFAPRHSEHSTSEPVAPDARPGGGGWPWVPAPAVVLALGTGTGAGGNSAAPLPPAFTPASAVGGGPSPLPPPGEPPPLPSPPPIE